MEFSDEQKSYFQNLLTKKGLYGMDALLQATPSQTCVHLTAKFGGIFAAKIKRTSENSFQISQASPDEADQIVSDFRKTQADKTANISGLDFDQVLSSTCRITGFTKSRLSPRSRAIEPIDWWPTFDLGEAQEITVEFK